jgi:fucose permease
MKKNYKLTMTCCFGSSLVQSTVVNFLPLLFVMFHESFGIPLPQIALFVTLNFLVQLTVDFFAAVWVDYLGYKAGQVLAHVFCSSGLALLAILPDAMPTPFVGLTTCVIIYSIGAGLLEVLTSPIVESTPSDNKAAAMSLMHSFYCWGHVLVVLVSVAFFKIFGIENWRYLALFWAVLPATVGTLFLFAPVNHLIPEGQQSMSWKELGKSKLFWLMILMMVCAGSSELSVSQWVSAFAEKGLGVSKTVGDLAGPLSFAVLMGLGRVMHVTVAKDWDLRKFITFSAALCLVSYLLISLVPNPVINLIGCAICGFAISILWPGTLSLASKALPRAGTALFALLALAGDVGCSVGPTMVGVVSGYFGDNLKIGILSSIIFPVGLLLLVLFGKLDTEENK